MKKVILMFAVAATLVSCGQSDSEKSAQDSTQVVCDSTKCDSTKCDSTHTACHVDTAAVDSVKH